MATKIYADDFNKKKEIELPDGTILRLPQRTAVVYEKIIDMEKERNRISEYDYCKGVLEILYGKEGFKKIAPNGRDESLDYLEKVQLVSLELLMLEKEQAEREQIEKQADILEPMTRQMKTLSPIVDKV